MLQKIQKWRNAETVVTVLALLGPVYIRTKNCPTTNAETVSTVLALRGPLYIRARNAPTYYVAKMTRGVPQGPPSSPGLSNIFIDSLATATEASEHIRSGMGGFAMVGDDFLVQPESRTSL